MIKHIPNFITCLNLIAGSLGIYFVLVDEKPQALYFVLIGAFFDLLDGLVARLLKVNSDIGKQLDSLADLITFGLLPSFYMLVLLAQKTEIYWVALLIAVFSALRLAKFNIDESQTDHFKGLPTPANAILITSLFLIPFELKSWILIGITIFSCGLLVSNLKLIALKFSSFGWSNNEARWIMIMGITAGFLILQWRVLPFLVPFYIIVSLCTVALKKT